MKPPRLLILAVLALLSSAAYQGTLAAQRTKGTVQATPAPSKSLNVRAAEFGAKADGGDDTAAIQKALDAAGIAGGTVWIPAGTYMVDAVRNASGGKHGLAIRSNTTLRLAPGATLKALPNSSPAYSVLRVADASHVEIIGGTIEGERSAHKGSEGEWGMGITLLNAQDVLVEGVTVKECWGDGFYVGGASGCSNLRFRKVTADHNRRQGMSIVHADGVTVLESTFRNTAGTAPEFGVDLEPNAHQKVSNVLIKGCTFTNNAGGGVWGGPPFKERFVASVTGSAVENCTFSGNGASGYNGGVVGFSACSGNAIRNNVITGNLGVGIMLRSQALDHQVTGNLVTGTQGDGIRLEDCEGSTISGNTVMGNTGYGIKTDRGHGATITGNTVTGNGKTP
jgi:parallel beta-helix repeat protein